MATLGATLRGLSPLGPLFGKELRVTARRKRTYWLRFLYLLALLLVLLMPYTATYYEMQYGGAARKAQKLAELGIWFFGTFSFFTLGAMALVSPILTCTAINTERLHKTLPVLLMTPITAWQIVAGKLCSRLLIAFTLIALSLPVLALVRLLGGVELEQMFASIAISAAVALFGASVGLLLSTLMNRAYAVILLSYGLMGVLYGLVPLISGLVIFEMLNKTGNAGQKVFFTILSVTNPALQMFLVSIPERPPFRLLSWHYVVLLHVALSALLVLLSAVILRRMAKKENEGSGGAPAIPAMAPPSPWDASAPAAPGNGEAHGAPAPALPTPLPLAYGNPGNFTPARTVSDNPVLWREIRRPLIPKMWQRIALTLFLLGALLLIYIALAAANDLDDNDAQIGFAMVFCGLINLLACVLAGTAIATEKESDTWTLLLATPISAARIVWGKFAGLLRRMVWPMILIAAHFLIFTIAGVIEWTAFLIVLWLIITTNITWLCTGLYFSLRLRTVTFAVIANLLGPVIAYGLVAVLLAIAGAVIDRRPEWAEVSMLYAPYVYTGVAVEQMSARRAAYYYGANNRYNEQRYYVPVYGRVSRGEFIGMVTLCGLGHLAVSGMLLWYMVAQFNHIVGRAPQRDPLQLSGLPHRSLT